MEVNLDQENKIVEIWLTHSESQNEDLRQILKPQIAEYHQKKFLVVVYESGKADPLPKLRKKESSHNTKRNRNYTPRFYMSYIF